MHPTRAAHERGIPTNPVRAGARTASVIALGLALALMLLAADAAQANTLHAPTASPGAQATVPMTISASGSADPTATLRVYVQQGGACPSSANVEAGTIPAGSTEVIAHQPVGPFAYSGTYTPPVAGAYSICALLFGASNAGTSASSTSFAVGPAPPPPAAPPEATSSPTAPGVTNTTPAKTRCVVPTLKGRTYRGARLLIRRAGCSVGSVFRPDLRTGRVARARGRVLRVVLQYPKPRRVRKLGARVTLRLAYVTPRRSSR